MRPMLARSAALLLIGGSLLAYGGAKAADTSDNTRDEKAGMANVLSFPTDLDGEIRRAQLLRVDGKLDDATRALGQLMLVAPDDPRVVGEYGKVLVLENRPQDATAFLKRSIELQGSDWTLYSALGVAYDEQGDAANAKAAYERALVLKPGEPSVLNNYAMSRKAAGDLAGARRMIAEADAANGADATISRNYAMLGPADAPAMPAPAHEEAAGVAAPAQVAPATSSAGPSANTAPREVGGVVMQRVPVDPLAGPVRKAHAKPGVASHGGAHKPAVAAKKVKTPSLRTSADAS